MARWMGEHGKAMWIRHVLVPGLTDDEAELREMSDFIKSQMCIRDRRYNYQPNSNAKHLKQQSSDGLALIVKGTQNMLFVDILEKMQAILEERGYVSTVYYIDEEANEVAQAELCLLYTSRCV